MPYGINIRFQKTRNEYPGRTAIIYGTSVITYSALDCLVEKTVSNLLDKIPQEQIEGHYICIYTNSDLDAVVAQLAVLRMGAICVPLDRRVPFKYYFPLDIKPIACLITDSSYELGTELNFPIVSLDFTMHPGQLSEMSTAKTERPISQHTHCIMTSGTTGKPKAVLLRQEGVLNQIDAKIQLLNLNDNSIVCLSMNLSFVASIWQIFATLFVGGTLVILDEQKKRNPYDLFKTCNKYHVSVLAVVPSVLKAYLMAITNNSRKLDLKSLLWLIVTGEPIAPSLVSRFNQDYNIPLINAYGQTECSDDTFHFKIPTDFVNASTRVIPIGKPIPNIQYAIVDRQGSCVVPGEKGELCIAGVCLAEGYINDNIRTQCVFRPLAALNGVIVFTTGDIVSEYEDGILVCHGRIDNQIKINGIRIEPEAIENVCLAYPGIKDVVAVKTNSLSGSFLELKYSNEPEMPINIPNLKSFLMQHVPLYMIPSVFTNVNMIKYHKNGKKCRDNNEIQSQASDFYISQKENIYKLIELIFHRQLGRQFDRRTSVRDLVLDSLEFIDFVVAVENVLKINFDDDKLIPDAFLSTDDLVDYVTSKNTNNVEDVELALKGV
jgi:amino acid adenylation domain-containing protein